MTRLRNKKYITLCFFLIGGMGVYADNFSTILKSIEQNNVRLKALKQQTEVVQEENKTENRLADPEVGVNYLWGNNGIGNRIDLNVSQSFEFPVVYAKRHKLIRTKNENVEIAYLNEKQEILLKARLLCIDIVYCNALARHIENDLKITRELAVSLEKQYQKGEATSIDYHKALQSSTVFQGEYNAILTQKKNLLEELRRMNGNNALILEDSCFSHSLLPKDFDTWMSRQSVEHPLIRLAEGETSEKEQALKLVKSQWLPNISVGYMSEKEKEDCYQGATFSVSLPLWSNHRRIKSAKKQLEAMRLMQSDTRLEVMGKLRGLYNEALDLQTTLSEYLRSFKEADNTMLLQKALVTKQINLITYLQEIQWGHELQEKRLQVERDFERKVAELTAHEM